MCMMPLSPECIHYFIHYGGVFIAGGELPSGHRPLTSGKLPSAQTGSLGVILVGLILQVGLVLRFQVGLVLRFQVGLVLRFQVGLVLRFEEDSLHPLPNVQAQPH